MIRTVETKEKLPITVLTDLVRIDTTFKIRSVILRQIFIPFFRSVCFEIEYHREVFIPILAESSVHCITGFLFGFNQLQSHSVHIHCFLLILM